jgi:hypothetical protein
MIDDMHQNLLFMKNLLSNINKKIYSILFRFIV